MSSSTATGISTAGGVHARTHAQSILNWLESQALMITGLAAIGAFSLTKLPQHITQDTWLALVDGRYIAAHGIPSHDTLFVMTHGVHWYDQQWLAQLWLYWLNQIGGLAAYGLAYAALTMLGFALAIGAARTLGGSERHVLWLLPIVGFLYFAGSSNVRTQGFAYPLFSATVWLLARETAKLGELNRRRDRWIYLVFPILILWGNLHGSVTLGVGLAVIAGVVLLADDLRAGRWRHGIKSVRARSVLLLLSPICLLVNPYGLGMIHYYGETVFNPAFGKVISEWQPITASLPLAIPFFALAFVAVWLMGRSGRRMPAFDQLALIVLAAAAVFAVRNVVWFGLGATILIPRTLTSLYPTAGFAERRRTINLSLVGISAVVLVGATIAIAVKPSAWFERFYDSRALTTVSAIARQDPGAKIYADNRYADWLLWHEPQLTDRIAYDIRFELLTTRQLQALTEATQIPAPHERNLLSQYRILLLQKGGETPRVLNRRGTDLVLHGHGLVVATWRPPA